MSGNVLQAYTRGATLSEAAAPKALEAAVQENRIRLCVYMMITEMDTQKHVLFLSTLQ